ncbi:hypothetical protein FZ025_17165 [Xanthomonas hyacinthi]|uniref:HTH luxR-type domain-containing protein n=1 Tax=Xanthomonas hyacinthi TaxID=56455 RepID=A0A2S7F1P6_9XANT|nr:autoinducer binding domain-containing protein [Xanthomonas hyacinthi]KLD78886.1 hypothetical protein Y886_07755 [Xanthomonas hyacinthi DSM 19077]PPU99293.1 hypothetical protein XhyaCFBP1156_03215 [Xanthomonas hyacinthi]QGY78282.1 hypothetical protein FZ025_17165 [Xanthomonas hyacinthi]
MSDYSALIRSIEQISSCGSEFDLHLLLRAIFAEVGVDSYFFTTIFNPEEGGSNSSVRFLIGCHPRLIQLYQDRKWFMNDPVVEYAKSNTAPMSMESLSYASTGQRELRDAIRAFGYHGGVIIPVHTGSTKRGGLLCLWACKDKDVGDLMDSRVILRSMAMELLEWWVRNLKQEAIIRFKLTDREIKIMRLTRRGYDASNIATEIGVSTKVIYAKTKSIRDKLNAENLRKALNLIDAYGLLDT